jgi:putative endonuclease
MSYYVYILASRKDGAIYLGVTNDIVRRVYDHRTKAVRSFTSKYNITRLVWFEIYDDPISAISREKELKKWKRAWKTQLIEAQNPQWNDLYESICSSIRHSGMVLTGRRLAPVRWDQTSDVQLHIGESRDSGFALRAPRNDG